MQPRLGRRDEPAQEQRGGDRAAEIAGGDVVEVRHLGLEQRLVGPPQRHAPQRIVFALGAVGERRRERIVVGVERRGLRPPRPPPRPPPPPPRRRRPP